MLEKMIETNHMLDHKILLFLLEPGQIDAEIRGLIANKFMAKYQRPCCLLTKTITKKDVLIQSAITKNNNYIYPHKTNEIVAYSGPGYEINGYVWGSGVEEIITY